MFYSKLLWLEVQTVTVVEKFVKNVYPTLKLSKITFLRLYYLDVNHLPVRGLKSGGKDHLCMERCKSGIKGNLGFLCWCADLVEPFTNHAKIVKAE